MMTRKLKHYFLAHSVRVVFNRPLAHVLQSKEATWQIAQWAVEIGQFNIEFIPRWAIKSQALADLLWSGPIQVCEELISYPIIG
jgi:hypothetical protein